LGLPCGGHGTQHGGRQNDRASNPVNVPGINEIGRRGPPQVNVAFVINTPGVEFMPFSRHQISFWQRNTRKLATRQLGGSVDTENCRNRWDIVLEKASIGRDGGVDVAKLTSVEMVKQWEVAYTAAKIYCPNEPRIGNCVAAEQRYPRHFP
jgi:hypothetical protein